MCNALNLNLKDYKFYIVGIEKSDMFEDVMNYGYIFNILFVSNEQSGETVVIGIYEVNCNFGNVKENYIVLHYANFVQAILRIKVREK